MVMLWFQLADGNTERLTEAEVDGVCDVLWSYAAKGSVSLVAKISHERRRPPAVQGRIELSENESRVFRAALDRTRASASHRPARAEP